MPNEVDEAIAAEGMAIGNSPPQAFSEEHDTKRQEKMAPNMVRHVGTPVKCMTVAVPIIGYFSSQV